MIIFFFVFIQVAPPKSFNISPFRSFVHIFESIATSSQMKNAQRNCVPVCSLIVNNVICFAQQTLFILSFCSVFVFSCPKWTEINDDKKNEMKCHDDWNWHILIRCLPFGAMHALSLHWMLFSGQSKQTTPPTNVIRLKRHRITSKVWYTKWTQLKIIN